MREAVTHLFAWLCGQNPTHSWAPGGIMLPCCQRCSGLYAGAALAVLALFWLRPRLSKSFLEVHGACLVFMVPLGLHWVAQGPVLRTVSGVLFGFGVAAFLWLPLASRLGWETGSAFPPRLGGGSARVYGLTLLAAAALVPALAALGGAPAAYALTGLVCAGALGLAGLALAALISLAGKPRPPA